MANRPRTLDFKKARILITDGTTPTANSLEVFIGEGTLQYNRRRNIDYIKNRGILDHTREGDEEPLELSLSAAWESIISNGAEPITITEALERNGAAAAWVSTGNECEPYAVDIVVEIRQDCGTVLDEVLYFREFRFEELGGNLQEGTIDISGMCQQNVVESIRTALAAL